MFGGPLYEFAGFHHKRPVSAVNETRERQVVEQSAVAALSVTWEPAPQECAAENPLSSAFSPDRFRHAWLEIVLNRSIVRTAIASFRFGDFLRRRLLAAIRPTPEHLARESC